LDWKLLRDCTVPMQLVGDGEHAHPRRIAAAVDTAGEQAENTPLNRRIVEAANMLALQCDAELHLVHVFDPMADLHDFSGFSASWVDLAGDRQARERSDYAHFADAFGVPQERRHFLLGPPPMTLARFARETGIDVLVMGRIQRRGLNRYVGSTTEHILYEAPGSLLAI